VADQFKLNSSKQNTEVDGVQNNRSQIVAQLWLSSLIFFKYTNQYFT